MQHYDDRFKDAPWYEKSSKETVLLVGAGGIGGNALYCLAKTIPATYYVIDHDIVSAANVGCQFFNRNQVGQYKVGALQDTLNQQSSAVINPLTRRYSSETTNITIVAVDNMATRKQVFEAWKRVEGREILIEGRLRANYYEIYVVTPGKEEEYEKTLFDDSEVDEGPCTFKQTAYFGMLIGARITQVLVNYLTNKYSADPVCVVPFKITEMGEPFLIEVV